MSKVWGIGDIVPPELFDEQETVTAADVEAALVPPTELDIVMAFFNRVCKRAEANMEKTGKLEGAHYAAMLAEIAEMRNNEQ